MGRSKTQTWIVGTVVLIILILAATWFLMVTPKLSQTQETRDANDNAIAEQDQLRNALATLRSQFENIDAMRAELDVLRTQIPDTPRLSEYVRQLDAIAVQFGVTITQLGPAVPEPFGVVASTTSTGTGVVGTTDGTGSTTGTATGDAAVGEAEQTAENADAATATTDDATAEPTDTTATTGALPVALAGMGAVPVSITVVGPYTNVMGFLEAVQIQIPRLLLVTGFSGLSQSVGDAMSGRPATAAGDLELAIQGFMYYLVPGATAVTGEEAVTEPTPLPASERNPFAPVTG